MKKCASKDCNTNILDTYTHCGRCHRALQRAAKKAKKQAQRKKRAKARPAAGPKLFGSDGRVRVGMGLKRCAQEDYERKAKIANALIRWAETINRLTAERKKAA